MRTGSLPIPAGAWVVFIPPPLCYTPGMFRPTVLMALTLFAALFGCSRGEKELSGPTPEQEALLARARRAIDAQEMFLQNGAALTEPRYAQNLAELLAFDETLTDDQAVTFHFGDAGEEGYRLTLQYPDVDWRIECDTREDCRLVK